MCLESFGQLEHGDETWEPPAALDRKNGVVPDARQLRHLTSGEAGAFSALLQGCAEQLAAEVDLVRICVHGPTLATSVAVRRVMADRRRRVAVTRLHR